MERPGLGLDHVGRQIAVLDDRGADQAPATQERLAPVLGESGEPLLVRDEVSVPQELSEPDRFEGGGRAGSDSRRIHKRVAADITYRPPGCPPET